VELLNHLISSHRGKTDEQVFVRLRDEVAEDQEVLRGLLHDLDAEGGAFHTATAFLSGSSREFSCCSRIPQAVNWHDSRSLKPLPWELKASEHCGVPFLL
jgi:hypothetical protein